MLFQRHLSKWQKSRTKEILLFDSLTGWWILWDFPFLLLCGPTWLKPGCWIFLVCIVFSTICAWF